MEEMRSFGYICPECGKPVIASRSVFALTAAAARMECACEKSTLEVQTDGLKFRLWVPCGLCGKTHQAECSADAVLRGRGVGLACPETGQLCCFIGSEEEVERQMKELEIRAEKEKSESPEAFTDNVIMYEVLSELRDIASRGGVDEAVDARELARLIDAFLRRLPERECNIFLRRYWFVDGIDAIALRFSMKPNTVKSVLLRTREKLRRFLQQEGISV